VFNTTEKITDTENVTTTDFVAINSKKGNIMFDYLLIGWQMYVLPPVLRDFFLPFPAFLSISVRKFCSQLVNGTILLFQNDEVKVIKFPAEPLTTCGGRHHTKKNWLVIYRNGL
jgi:hypothetical protein